MQFFRNLTELRLVLALIIVACLSYGVASACDQHYGNGYFYYSYQCNADSSCGSYADVCRGDSCSSYYGWDYARFCIVTGYCYIGYNNYELQQTSGCMGQ